MAKPDEYGREYCKECGGWVPKQASPHYPDFCSNACKRNYDVKEGYKVGYMQAVIDHKYPEFGKSGRS